MLVVFGAWLMVTDGREKMSVLKTLSGRTVTVGLARGPYGRGSACRGRFSVGESRSSVTFFEDAPDFQRGAFGLRDPAKGEVVRLGQIQWIRTADGTLVRGPWTKLWSRRSRASD
jgi:hypothetical protein